MKKTNLILRINQMMKMMKTLMNTLKTTKLNKKPNGLKCKLENKMS